MSYAYRCMKCRGRMTLRKKIEHYIRVPKCRHCKVGVTYYWDKARNGRKDYCWCGGYHYTHRKGSTFCEHNPKYEFNVRTRRYGEDPKEVELEIAMRAAPAVNANDTEECPF